MIILIQEIGIKEFSLKDIKCPICNDNILIKIKDYKINMYNCKNGHKFDNILLKEFVNMEKLDISELLCNICKIKNLNNNELYRCLECKNNLCSICKLKHNKNHKIINYQNKNDIYNKSNELLDSENLENNNIKSKLIELKKYIYKFKTDIKELIKKFNNIIDNIKIYYSICHNIIFDNDNANSKNKNEFVNYNNIIIKDILEIIREDNIEIKIKNLINIYNKINHDINNYIIAEVDIKEEEINKDIRIINTFEKCKRDEGWEDEDDDYKCENEIDIKNNCQIMINNNKIPFSYFFKFNKVGKYIIQYSFKNKITKTACLFYGCSFLRYIDLSNFNTENVTNMVSMFRECSSLENINLSNFNTENVSDIGAMFYGCNSLMKINVQDFNTQNMTNMANLFYV